MFKVQFQCSSSGDGQKSEFRGLESRTIWSRGERSEAGWRVQGRDVRGWKRWREGREFSSLTAWWRKLLPSLEVKINRKGSQEAVD